MRMCITAALIFPAFVIALAGNVHAQSQETDYWPRVNSQDKSYSVETPCTTLEVEQGSQEPLEINESTADAGTTVLCMVDEALFSSGIISVSLSELGGQKIFDILLPQLASSDASENVEITLTKISGKRAILSREVLEGEVGQTGVIELADNKLLMIISGGPADDVSALTAMIDRHAKSLRVPSQ